MSQLEITFTGEGFPNPFNGTLTDFYDTIVANLTAHVDSDYLILGKIGGTAPTANVGPWVNGNTWYSWNGTAYAPMRIKVGTAAFQVTLAANPTANRTAGFQNKDGTVALLSDIYVPRATKILSTVAPVIDWSLSSTFYQHIGANVVATMINSQPGQEIAIVVNTSGAFTFTFPASVAWVGGTAPVQTSGGTDMYLLKNVAGTILGRALQDYS